MSSPVEMFGTQNLKDDDGQVIDTFLIETDAPPKLADATESITVKELDVPRKITRIISRDQVLDPAWVSATLLLPADANRKSLTVAVFSPTAVATDGIRFSDDIGNLPSSAKLLHNNNIALTEHTGPLYAFTCGNGTGGVASAVINVEVWSVTE
jgi:hypothetical protein